MGVSVFSAVMLLGIAVMSILVYGRDTSTRKRAHLMQVIGFTLLFLQSIVIYIPMPATYADPVITLRLIVQALAYVFIGMSFLFELLPVEKFMSNNTKKYSKLNSSLSTSSAKTKSKKTSKAKKSSKKN